MEKYSIVHHLSSPYRPQTDGTIEPSNKNVKIILGKMTDTYNDWFKKLSVALWGYRMSIRSSIGARPYSLVHRMETVLPVKVEIASLRVLVECEVSEFD